MNVSQYAAKNLHDFFRPFGKVLTRPEYKKCFSAVKGMIQGKTVVLSEIGRKVSAEIQPKTFCEKVGKMLGRIAALAEVQLRKFEGIGLELLIVDESDCQRRHAEKIKGILKMRDGSTGDPYGKGYGLFSVVAKTKDGAYAPLVMERFEEQNPAAEKIIKKVIAGLSPDHRGIWTMDRGFDDRKIFDLLLGNEQQFLIRIDRRGSQRLLIVGEDEKHLVSTLTAHMGGIGYRRVRLPGRKEELTLIHYHRKRYREPMALLTTLTPKTMAQAKKIAKLYLKRWKIEDYHRFFKTRFSLEDMMLQKPERVDGLLALVLVASAFIMKCEQEKRDYALEVHYQKWLKENNVVSSWSAFCRFFQKLFENWTLSFRTLPHPPNSLQLALIPI